MDFYSKLKIIENTPHLETERLVLRKFTPEDLTAVFFIYRDKEANTFLPWFPIETPQQAQKLLEEDILPAYQLPSAYRYAICLKEDNVPIGYLNVSDNDSHDMGYGLRKEFWHRGIATEACKALLERLRLAGFPYVTATHDQNNPRSGEVMKKLGMTYRYSYEEQWQPKNIPVTFKLYQIDFDPSCHTYQKYWEESAVHFIEKEAALFNQ